MCIPCPYTLVYHVTLDTVNAPTLGAETVLKRHIEVAVKKASQNDGTSANSATVDVCRGDHCVKSKIVYKSRKDMVYNYQRVFLGSLSIR